MDYSEKNPDWIGWSEKVSAATGKVGENLWIENLRKNRELFRQRGKQWANDLQGLHKGKTAIMIGASPALANQLNTLREIQHDSDFVLFAISCNLKYLLDNEIKPKYVITVDANESQGDFFDGLDMALTKDITLITNTFSYPEMLKIWEGPLKWLALASGDKPMMKKQAKWYNPMNGIGYPFPALSSQYNIGTAVCVLVLQCKIVIFVGNELSFKDKEVTYYVDRKDEKDEWVRKPALDIYGNVVYTNYMLSSLKISSEWFIDKIKNAAWWFNCTEAGIFGVSKRNGNEPHIWQLKLVTGIAQAREIMRTGEPFLLHRKGSIVESPRLDNIKIEHFQYAN